MVNLSESNYSPFLSQFSNYHFPIFLPNLKIYSIYSLVINELLMPTLQLNAAYLFITPLWVIHFDFTLGWSLRASNNFISMKWIWNHLFIGKSNYCSFDKSFSWMKTKGNRKQINSCIIVVGNSFNSKLKGHFRSAGNNHVKIVRQKVKNKLEKRRTYQFQPWTPFHFDETKTSKPKHKHQVQLN